MKKKLENLINNHQDIIQQWFASKNNMQSPFYTSVDIRNVGIKSAVIDTNLFPSGFNNLNLAAINNAIQEVKSFIEHCCMPIRNIAIFTELFTRNYNYWEHIKILRNIFLFNNLTVKLVTCGNNAFIKAIENNFQLQIYRFTSSKNYIVTEDNWHIDLLILNNDLINGLNKEFINSKTQIMPAPFFGWYKRSKYKHFQSYINLVKEFCNLLDIDPWLFCTYVHYLNNVSFRQKTGFCQLAQQIDELIEKVSIKYNQYGIKKIPHIFIKADNGSFGRGIIPMYSGRELLSLNKKNRHNMNISRKCIINTNVLLQEGIETIERYKQQPAENSIYLVHGNLIGGFTRYNTIKNAQNNLNSKGMAIIACHNISVVESIIARIATLSTMMEKI